MYILASPSSGKAVVYDMRTKTWTVFTNVPFSNAILWDRTRKFTVSVSNEIRLAMTSGKYDNVISEITTKWIGQATPELFGRRLFLALRNCSSNCVNVTPIVDGKEKTTISNAINAPLPVTKIELPEEIQGNYIAYRLTFSGKIEIMELAMQFEPQREWEAE